ncbi:response regulator [Sphingomicrobium astaxanthinifaciens]|uniref:response regulator n=1 Tax=Sphingomicrobium astaxanthinifaciens TaxID=1227949 RepID=UPI001FCAA801|nr:response regulator [Sphingomicrobium astaxanthinifaciens]MCJ7421857.1 response regulator [Sphingomicrobium astaxanthinifaciens]
MPLSLGVNILFGKSKRAISRILVVEDEPLTAFDNEQRLERLGYVVVGTRDNYEDARRDMEFETVDLVLADIQLAGEKSGIDVARVASDKGIPVLFATGNPPEECRSFALGSLVKPYTDRQLKDAIAAIDALVGGRRFKAVKGLKLYVTP